MVTASRRIFGLDAMRTTAILMVLFSHAAWLFPESETVTYHLLQLLGFLGVEIFFVLSGFLIGKIVYRGFVTEGWQGRQLLYFWVRRWFRTLPNYYLVLLIILVTRFILNKEFPEGTWRYFFFFQNLSTNNITFFPESWSLTVEELAYVVAPLALFCLLHFKIVANKKRAYIIAVALLIVVCIILKVIYHFNSTSNGLAYWNSHLKSVAIFRVDAIYLGMLAAVISFEKKAFWQRKSKKLALTGFFALLMLQVVLAVFQLTFEKAPMFWNVLYLPLNSIIISLFLPWCSQLNNHLGKAGKWVVFISLISYSMYLLHYSLVLYSVKNFIIGEQSSTTTRILAMLLYLTVTVTASWILYTFFERPVTKVRDSTFIRRKLKA